MSVNENLKTKQFGDFSQHDLVNEELLTVCIQLCRFPSQNEHERNYLLAAVRRTLSLSKAFKQAIDSQNGQMAATLVRLNLDTLARSYALYWAEETVGMSAESFSKAISEGESVRNMKLRGGKNKATDRWLIQQIEGLGDWIPEVYRRSSGAIHFSDFHIKQMLGQMTSVKKLDDGSLYCELVIGAGENDADPELYRELKQAYLHISMMIIAVVSHRVELIADLLMPDSR